MSEIRVEELTEDQHGAWNALVHSSPYGTIFHTTDFLRLSAEEHSLNVSLFGFYKGNTMIGGCSLFIRDIRGILKVASSTCEMHPFGGLVLHPEYVQKDSSHNLLHKGVTEIISQKNLDAIYLQNPPDLQDVRSFIWNDWQTRILYTYVFDLTRNIEQTISRNAARNIRKANNLGIRVEESDDSNEYYRLFNLTFGRRNLKNPVSESFFKKVLQILQRLTCGKLWLACSPTDEYLSGEITIWDTKRAYSWSAASDYAKSSYGATRLLQYEILRSLQENGHKEIYLFCANIPNLASFMAEFHPTLLPYYGIQYVNMKYRLAEKTQQLVKDWFMGMGQIFVNGSKLFS